MREGKGSRYSEAEGREEERMRRCKDRERAKKGRNISQKGKKEKNREDVEVKA